MDQLPGELSCQCVELSEEIQERCRTVAEYENSYSQSRVETKRATAKAIAVLQKSMSPSMAKIVADADEEVIKAQDKEQEALALLTMGKAELDGMTARFQALKKSLELKIEEIRHFRG